MVDWKKSQAIPYIPVVREVNAREYPLLEPLPSVLEKFGTEGRLDPVKLTTELQRILARGYASDDMEYHDDVRCLAVPIRDSQGAVVAAVGVTGPLVLFAKKAPTDLIARPPAGRHALTPVSRPPAQGVRCGLPTPYRRRSVAPDIRPAVTPPIAN